MGVGRIASVEQLLLHDMPITQDHFRVLHRDDSGQLIRQGIDGLGDPEAIHGLEVRSIRRRIRHLYLRRVRIVTDSISANENISVVKIYSPERAH